jgi:hypothetical protein
MKKNEMIEDLEYLGAFSPGEVKPGFMTADVTHREKNRPPLHLLLGKEGKEITAHAILFKGDMFRLVQANGTEGIMVFHKGH